MGGFQAPLSLPLPSRYPMKNLQGIFSMSGDYKERYEVLREFTQLISSGVNIERIARTVVNQAAFRFGADVVLLFTVSSTDEQIDLRSAYGVRKGDLPGSISPEGSLLERAFRFGGSMSIPNFEHQSDTALGFLK